MDEKNTQIKSLISAAGEFLLNKFEFIKKTNPHQAEKGAETEEVLEKFLNDHLPKRFAASSGLVIDYQDQISSQIDVIVYDALNSPIYRKDERVLILPSDNVAVAIEVKSILDKAELEDAAKKISSVKKLKRSPITNVDQQVTMGSMVMTNTLGVVFAYNSRTTLQTLTENLRDINQTIPSNEWIDMVVVLDKGVIGYGLQHPFSRTFPGHFGGVCADDFPVIPFYIHLVKEELGKFTLNRFFLKMMSHLTFYRKRSVLDFEAVMGKSSFECMTIQGYQFNLEKRLVQTEQSHTEGKLTDHMIMYDLIGSNKNILGQICWLPWQDGAALTYTGVIRPHQVMFKPFFDLVKVEGLCIPAMGLKDFWLSSVLPLSKDGFIKTIESIQGPFKAVRSDELKIKEV